MSAASSLVAVAVDCRDPEALAAFWCAVLGSSVVERWTDPHGTPYVGIGLVGDAVLLFQQVHDDGRAGKNRLHLDVRPAAGSQQDEIDRVVALGATVVDEAPDNHWVVLVDPEGNEFCVVAPRPQT